MQQMFQIIAQKIHRTNLSKKAAKIELFGCIVLQKAKKTPTAGKSGGRSGREKNAIGLRHRKRLPQGSLSHWAYDDDAKPGWSCEVAPHIKVLHFYKTILMTNIPLFFNSNYKHVVKSPFYIAVLCNNGTTREQFSPQNRRTPEKAAARTGADTGECAFRP